MISETTPPGARLGDLPRPVALVLSGGGAYGAAQVGQLRALAECGFAPDLVVGTSVGALHGAMVARWGLGDAVDRLDALWPTLGRRAVFGPRRRVVTNLRRLRRPASADPLRALIDDAIGPIGIDELPLRFGAVAADEGDGTPVTITAGPVADALIASSAVPGVFPPVELDGRLLIDGGVSANLPVRQAVALGAAGVVALDVAPPELVSSRRGPVGALLQSGAILLRSQASREAGVPTLVVPSPSPPDVGLFAFAKWEELRALGHEGAAAALGGAAATPQG
ncbi:MAG: patatin-like phospholipase family protein [Acidimicrobiales bacterium]